MVCEGAVDAEAQRIKGKEFEMLFHIENWIIKSDKGLVMVNMRAKQATGANNINIAHQPICIEM